MTHAFKNKKTYCKDRPGFTLVEIFLVTMIIMIIASLSIPRFKKTFDHLQYRNSVENFLALCKYAREAAVLKRTTLWVCVDDAENKYWLGKYYIIDGERIFQPLRGRYGRKIAVPRRVDMISDSGRIPFFPDGGSEETVVRFLDGSGDSTRIRIHKITGKIDKKQ